MNIGNMVSLSASNHFIYLKTKRLHMLNNRVALRPICKNVNITMFSCFRSDKQIDCPSTAESILKTGIF